MNRHYISNSRSLGQASPSLSAFARGQAAAFKMFETIKRKPEIDAYDTTGRKLDDIPLVGQSGSGKSTVVSLIERFYDPQSGEVLIDGINLREFQLKWIRQKIGLVSQEPVLFTCSIKENIAYGKDGATDEEIRAAAELANAAKFIDKLPQGLDTMVGEHGTQLSGGQKQRVAIARAILKDPRILLLDEATSALDAESERIVQEALDRIMINRTTVIVAHRLSTIRNADNIAVIHQGKIVERGSHAELTKDPDGAYSQLIRLQEIRRSDKNVDDRDKLESIVHSGRHSSQRSSFIRSISQESLGVGNSGRHSFSASFGVPTAIGFTEPTGGGPQEPPSAAPSPPEVPLSRLVYLNKPEITVILMGTAAAVIAGAILPVFGLLLSKMISIFYEPAHELRKDSKVWALVFVGFAVLSLLAYPGRFYFFGVAGSKLIKRIRKMCFKKVVHMEVSWFDEAENSSGAIGARLSTDAASVRALVGDALGLLVQNIAGAITGLRLYEEASQVANDAVGSIRTVASFCAEDKVMELYQEKCEGPIKTGIKRGIISGIGFGLSFFVLYAVYATSFYAGARLVEDGKTSFTDVFRVFFALSMASIGISQSGSLVPDSTKAKSAAASIFAIIDRKSQIDPSDDSGITLEEVKGEIELKHVSFKYPTRPDVQIFRDLCLTIHSGKMGLVSQEPVLFNDTIRANIAYGKGDATESEIIAAAELANAHNFISSLQKRVAIARAIVKNPKILLLDEATSALDAESEKVVQDALDRVMMDRTTIVVAHRLSTIKGADLIAVVKNGVIAEKGKHEALLNKGGDYASLSSIKKMAEDINLNGDSDIKQDSKSKAKDEAAKTVPLYKLFSFSDPLDHLLMFVGTIGAIGNGISLPLMTLIFGNMINAFGGSKNSNQVVDEVSKVGQFLQFMATFIGGFVVAFIKGWLLTVVMLSCIPPLVLCGAMISLVISKASSTGQAAYSIAASVVEQTIGSIRTVASFTGEKQAIAKYNQSLIKAYKAGVQEALASGLGYGLAIWFGAKMIIEKGYTGGEVVTVIIAVLTGSMSLGQASPSVSAFAAGQAAAFKMFETIKRKPEIDAYDTTGQELDDLRGDIEFRE
ncbi:ABC transporter B family member 11, partial [Mucuna pruriens]